MNWIDSLKAGDTVLVNNPNTMFTRLDTVATVQAVSKAIVYVKGRAFRRSDGRTVTSPYWILTEATPIRLQAIADHATEQAAKRASDMLGMLNAIVGVDGVEIVIPVIKARQD